MTDLPEILRCPACRARLGSCAHPVPTLDGIVDLAPHLSSGAGKQRVMETRLFARLYETRLWRPLHARVASGDSLDAEIRDVLALAPTTGRSVDVACGTGVYTRAIAAHGLTVLGLDVSVPMLTRARALAPSLRFVRGDALALPLADATVDHVNCSGALHLFPDPLAVAREAARVLHPGGVFTGMTVGRRDLGPWSLQGLLERRAGFRFFDAEQLADDLRAVGFRTAVTRQRKSALIFGATQ